MTQINEMINADKEARSGDLFGDDPCGELRILFDARLKTVAEKFVLNLCWRKKMALHERDFFRESDEFYSEVFDIWFLNDHNSTSL